MKYFSFLLPETVLNSLVLRAVTGILCRNLLCHEIEQHLNGGREIVSQKEIVSDHCS